MRRLYSTLFCLAAPFLLLRLLWRGLGSPAYRRRIGERFGYIDARAQRAPVWVHAVSVGEVQAAVPLIREIRARFPRLPVLVTTMTPTGSDRLRELLGEAVEHSYVPYDLPGAVRRFFVRARPCLAVIMETELWPNLFHHAARAGVPVLLANARMSHRSAERYRRVAGLVRPALAGVTRVAAQGRADAERLVGLGAPPERVQVTGNMKFDLRYSASLSERAQVLRRGWGVNRPVWVAGSTHENEEQKILDALSEVRKQLPDCLLVLAPRHPERCGRVAALCRRRGLATVLRSEANDGLEDSAVLLVDSLGELVDFYAASDVAFVGGSLVPLGGHNPLEPASQGLPVLFGPHAYNFTEINELLLGRGAARVVRDARELGSEVLELLSDAELRNRLGEAGRWLVAQNQGAVRATFELLLPYLEGCLRES